MFGILSTETIRLSDKAICLGACRPCRLEHDLQDLIAPPCVAPMGKGVRIGREHVQERLGTTAQAAAGVLNYPPLLQIGSRREYIINRSDHKCQTEGRHSPNVFPCDGSLEDLIPCCPFALLALLHCQSDSFHFHLSPSLLNYHGCFGWCICRGPSLKVVLSNSMTINLNGPSYFLKSQNCL